MSVLKIKINQKSKFDIKEFSWQTLEFFVTNSKKGKIINIKLFRDYNKKSQSNDIYFLIEEQFYGKKRRKIKRVRLSFNKFVEIYQELKSIKLGRILAPQDDVSNHPTIRIEIHRWSSKIIIEWSYKTHPKWKKLDELIEFILGICSEKRILHY